jgi:hypothetical protein
MKLLEKSARHPDLPTLLRLAAMVVVAGTVLCAPIGTGVLANAGQQAASKDDDAIDPDAMAALDKMGAYLRTLKAFQVRADVATDRVLDDGQTIEFSSKVDMVIARPNRMRVEVTDDIGHRFFFFDGKDFTIYGQAAGFYATVPAPATLAKLSEDLNDKYGIELPLTDLFYWGTDEAITKRIKAADDIGPSTVDGITCEQYAFRQEGIDWQIWIQLGEFPLPRKLVIRTLTDDAKPQHSEILTWNLAPSFSNDAFAFVPPPGVGRITIAEVQAKAAEKK